MLIFALQMLVLAQSFPRPSPAGLQVAPVVSLGTTKASSSFQTGYLPFEFSFDCTFDPLKNGCWAATTVDFNTKSANGEWIFRGKQAKGPISHLKFAEVHLSGAEVSLPTTGATLPFAEIYVDSQTTQLTQYDVVTWYVHVNWRNAPGTMVDNFRVKVAGEVVWSTGVNSTVYQKNFSCSDNSDQCSSSQSFSTKGPFAGAAFGKIRLAQSGANTIRALSSAIAVSATGTNLTLNVTCSIAGSPSIECEQRVIAVSALATEMEAFSSAPFTYSGSLPFFSGQFQPQVGLSPHREMACGLRNFESAVAQPGYMGAFRIGASPTDCGFNGVSRGYQPGGWGYGGVMRHDFQIVPVGSIPQLFGSSFVLDGAKLLWP